MFPVPPPTLFSAPAAYIRWCFSAITYSSFEQKALLVRRNFEQDQSGYLEQQKTRPQTLGFALGDSPIGLLAWFVEKFQDWADVYDAFSDDDIITLVMMHWIQGATPALRFYREAFGRGMHEAERTFETYVSAPTGVSMYAKEQLHVRSPFGNLPALKLSNAVLTVPTGLGQSGCQHSILAGIREGWSFLLFGAPRSFCERCSRVFLVQGCPQRVGSPLKLGHIE